MNLTNLRKRKLLSLLTAAALAGATLAGPMAVPALAAERGDVIVILHTNDVHCAVDQEKSEDGKIGAMGYAAVAACREELESVYGSGNVTLVDAGDAIQGGPMGTLSDGAYLVDIMEQTGYDLAVPGNHEFDYGVEKFLSLAEGASFDYLCCNFTDMQGRPVLKDYQICRKTLALAMGI